MKHEASKRLSSVVPITIRRLRRANGLSQEQLAHLSGLDRTYISGIERSRRNITIASLDKIIPHISSSLSLFLHETLEDIKNE